MNFGKDEEVLSTFEKKVGSNITKLVLTNYRVALESSGSWFAKVTGLQSITLSSVTSANLVVKHNPSLLWISVIGLILTAIIMIDGEAIGFPLLEVGLPVFETAVGGFVLFVIGLAMYLRSRTSGIQIKSLSESLSVDAPQSKDAAYEFVNKVMEHRANNTK